MTPNELEQKISEIEKRSPIPLDGLFNCAKSDLGYLSPTELDEVEAVVGYSNSGRMGSSLYCVNKKGELVYKSWPLSSPLSKRELHPLKDNLLTPSTSKSVQRNEIAPELKNPQKIKTKKLNKLWYWRSKNQKRGFLF